jgi:ParB-like chromosome segregation protein Spo0J
MKINCAYTELRDIDLLVPHKLNPNKHPDRQLKYLAKIMDHQGWRSPVVVSNRSGFVICGHGRLEAARLNGWTQAPIDFQDFASEADEYAHLIADNKIAEMAEHDDALMIETIKADFPDIDLELLGLPDLALEVSETDLPDLPSGDRAPFQQMTFTLHDDQAEQVKAAIEIAKKMGRFESENENSNGNALARVCETFVTQNG